jgi:hypothetical protein
MKRATLAAVAFALGFAPLCHAQSKGGAVAVEQTDAVVTVTKVDTKARTVSFRGPKGGVATLMVPPEAQNLDQVKPGQQFRMKYVESVAVEIQKGGKASASATQEMRAWSTPSTTATATSLCAGRRATCSRSRWPMT